MAGGIYDAACSSCARRHPHGGGQRLAAARSRPWDDLQLAEVVSLLQRLGIFSEQTEALIMELAQDLDGGGRWAQSARTTGGLVVGRMLGRALFARPKLTFFLVDIGKL
jgi:hypothetical protein